MIWFSLWVWLGLAHADVDPKCAGLPKPPDYSEQVQQDFQANTIALAASYAPVHGAVPHQGGHGAVLVDLSVVPPLDCAHRYTLNWTKTEDVNKTPIIPRLVASYAFPTIADRVTFYGSFGVLPAIKIAGTRNLILSGEFGLGVGVIEHFELGLRGHATLQRTYGDIATAFDPETQPSIEDVYMASTWGIDVLASAPFDVKGQRLTPFVSAGYLDASTFFFVGDDHATAINKHPYAGATLSLGLDLLIVRHLRMGVAFYAAPGGYTRIDKAAVDVSPASRYGSLYTARARLGYEF